MMPEKNFLRAFVQRAEGSGQAGEAITFVASTEGIKRDGVDLRAQNWYLENYQKNPVFLWAHDYWGSKPPIGRCEVQIDGERLMARVTFDQGDEFARDIERKYREGYLNTVSVGWNFVEKDDRRVMDLLDISGVPVPGDPDALMVRQFEALRAIVEPAERAEGDWMSVAAAMVDVFYPPLEEGETEREKRYKALLPKYRRLGKVAPEWIGTRELVALSDSEIRGLFLEGEDLLIPARTGAVLSKRNLSDLEEAITLIQGVLARAVKEEEEETGEGEEDGERSNPVSTGDLMLQAMELQKKMIFGKNGGNNA